MVSLPSLDLQSNGRVSIHLIHFNGHTIFHRVMHYFLFSYAPRDGHFDGFQLHTITINVSGNIFAHIYDCVHFCSILSNIKCLLCDSTIIKVSFIESSQSHVKVYAVIYPLFINAKIIPQISEKLIND